MSHPYQNIVPTRTGRARVPWGVALAIRALGYLGRALIVIVHSRLYGSAAAACLSMQFGTSALGPLWPPVVFVIMAAAFAWYLIGYRITHYAEPPHVRESLRGTRRSLREYRWGTTTWGTTMRRNVVPAPWIPKPLLLSTLSTTYKAPGQRFGELAVDKLRVRVPNGLAPELDLQGDALERLRWAWRGEALRMLDPQPKTRTVELWCRRSDALRHPVAPFKPAPADGLPKVIQWALVEDGSIFELPVLGTGAANVFVCGISGAGKGSVVGSWIAGHLDAVYDGTAEIHGIDPQASEFGIYRHLMKRLVFTREDAADMLEDLVRLMHKRTRRIFGITRKHKPVPGDGLILVPIDEGLDLLDKSNRKLYNRIMRALSSLLRMGRKASIRILFISQRAELDVVGALRKDFQIFVALEQNLDTDVDMILGRGALASGAKAHLINQPGEAYLGLTKGILRATKGILRVRFPELTDSYWRRLPPSPGNENLEDLPAPREPEDPYDFEFGGRAIPRPVAPGQIVDNPGRHPALPAAPQDDLASVEHRETPLDFDFGG